MVNLARVTGRSDNPGSSLIPVVWFEVISRWTKSRGAPPSSLFFHKLTTLTRFRLEASGIPIPLPYSWFLFGPTSADLPHAVQIFSDSSREEGADETGVEWKGPVPELYEGDRAADRVRETVDSLLADYSPDEGELAVDEAYDHAPFDFQRKYRLVRMACGLTGLGSAERPKVNSEGVWPLALDAFETFPYDSFPSLAPSVATVREAVNVGLNANLDQRRRLATEAIEEFWGAFAYQLRADPVGRRDVSPVTVQLWRRAADRRFRRFTRNLGDIVVELSEWEPTVRGDAILGPLVEKRVAEQEREKRLIDDGFEALWGDLANSESKT